METSLGRFGDSRLEDRGRFVLRRLIEAGQGGIRVRPLGGNRAGEVGIGRFLHNPRVTPDEMISTACARTAGLVRGQHVLAIQDTTGLRDDGDQHSLQLHAMIAVNAVDGAMLGLTHAEFLYRFGGKKTKRKKRRFADKESRRWLDATCSASALAEGGAACVTVVADREGDIYEEFACKPASRRRQSDRGNGGKNTVPSQIFGWPWFGIKRRKLAPLRVRQHF